MKNYRVVLWALALAGLGADQAAKYSVFSWLARVDDNRCWLVQVVPDHGFALETSPPTLEADGSYTPHVNKGALWGIGREHGAIANLAFAAISLLAAGGIVYWSLKPGAGRDLWVCIALGLILAGTLGNLYDRVVFNGVRDFLHWNYLFDWPVFNVADSCLVCGAGLLLIQAFGRQPAAKGQPDAKAATARPAAPRAEAAPAQKA